MVLAVIPARYASTRFPGKPLALIGGQSMIRRVYDRVAAASSIDKVVVATDDDRIFEHVTQFGGQVMMTSPSHPSGTDRVAEVAETHPDYTIIVNVQGDEPFIDPNQIDQVVATFQDDSVDIATLAHLIEEEADLLSPDVVKVVKSKAGKALYFSRHPIPYLRDRPTGDWLDEHRHFQHIGLYAYRGAALRTIKMLSIGFLEASESLEQLRWLENGLIIQVEVAAAKGRGIDTPEDLRLAEDWLSRRGQ